MSKFQLSALAELDLSDIVDYTTDVWGADQAEKYLDRLVECMTRVANTPGIGRVCDAALPDLRRLEQDKHVIFYKPIERGILVVRVLHESMLPTRHGLMD